MAAQHGLLEEASRLFDDGTLRHTMRESYGPLNADNLRKAHAMLESGRMIGKLVLSGIKYRRSTTRGPLILSPYRSGSPFSQGRYSLLNSMRSPSGGWSARHSLNNRPGPRIAEVLLLQLHEAVPRTVIVCVISRPKRSASCSRWRPKASWRASSTSEKSW